MKCLLIVLLLSIGLSALAQPSPLRTRIENDNRVLTIQIDGIHNGRVIHYHQSFDVANMYYWQRGWLTYCAFRSVDVALPFQEMMGLMLTTVGLLLVVLIGLVLHFQYTKARLVSF